MKRRNFIKAGLFVPPVVTSLRAAPSFARPGSVAAPSEKKPITLINPTRSTPKLQIPEVSEGLHPKMDEKYTRVTRSFDSPLSNEDWKVNDWHTIKVKNESSLEQHLQLIWKRLRDFFLSSKRS